MVQCHPAGDHISVHYQLHLGLAILIEHWLVYQWISQIVHLYIAILKAYYLEELPTCRHTKRLSLNLHHMRQMDRQTDTLNGSIYALSWRRTVKWNGICFGHCVSTSTRCGEFHITWHSPMSSGRWSQLSFFTGSVELSWSNLSRRGPNRVEWSTVDTCFSVFNYFWVHFTKTLYLRVMQNFEREIIG